MLVSEHDELHAVAGAELGQEAPHVRLHRRLGHEQRVADLEVRRAARDLQQNCVLALGQRLEAWVRRRARQAIRDRVQLVVFAYESGLVRPGSDPGATRG